LANEYISVREICPCRRCLIRRNFPKPAALRDLTETAKSVDVLEWFLGPCGAQLVSQKDVHRVDIAKISLQMPFLTD
jgi:hypothetical protein